MTTIYGTSGDDRLRGTAKADAIYGQQGDDLIRGAQGRDFLYGDSAQTRS
jgi:Ca2+-binding RTX toxin-like protein